MSAQEPDYARMETMRRLGVKFVVCSHCGGTMREPADPFQGPNVLWGPPLEPNGSPGRLRGDDETLYYVCSSGCHDRMRARLRANNRRTSTTKHTRRHS